MCQQEKPLSEFGLYPNGKPLAHCKSCHNEASNASRAKRKMNSRIEPDYTEVRHPDPAVMESNVEKMAKFYAEQEAKIKKANLKFTPEAGLCDILLDM